MFWMDYYKVNANIPLTQFDGVELYGAVIVCARPQNLNYFCKRSAHDLPLIYVKLEIQT